MKKYILSFFSITLCLSTFAQKNAIFTVELSNHWEHAIEDAPIIINLNDINPGFKVCSAMVKDEKQEIPSQLDDLNGDLKADELVFVIHMAAKSHTSLQVTLSSNPTKKSYPARVFAQMLAREPHKQKHAPVQSITVPGSTDFYNMVQGHGPMFESELVGYRIYFNQKQTIDPYGKFQKKLELKDTQFYPSLQQRKDGYGDDVLLVGNSCGIGTLKGWNGTKATHIEPIVYRTERILAAGPVRSIVEVEVKGWKYQGKELNMTHRYILYAGHRDLRIETYFNEPLDNETFCTGVQNIMGHETVSYSNHKDLIGSWGRHWPVNDTINYAKESVGIATYIPQKYVKQEVSDADNFLYTIGAKGYKNFYHYTMFTSSKETFGYATSEAWFKYMQTWREVLQHPLKIQIRKIKQ
ncbi:hypothetical protein, secreted [gut metagenome]|uniref:DUF4861 domain-containing protein n=1 Tax=gut metagenome TaxID=749906 RepID=J9FXR4_9ZZZZ